MKVGEISFPDEAWPKRAVLNELFSAGTSQHWPGRGVPMLPVEEGNVGIARVRYVTALNHEDVFAGAFTLHELENTAAVQEFLAVSDFVGIQDLDVLYRTNVVGNQLVLVYCFAVLYP